MCRCWRNDDVVEVGKFCSAAEDVILLGGNHTTEAATFPVSSIFGPVWDPRDGSSKGPIKIYNDVWIGFRSTILSNVTIGTGAIVAAGSVVTRDVRSFTVVGGNPAREIKERFDDRIRLALVKIAWWNWPDDKIRDHIEDFYLPAAEFCRKHYS